MKKVLLIGLILAILLLAFPQGVMAAEKDKEVEINAAYAGGELSFDAYLTAGVEFNWALVEALVGGANARSAALTFTLDSPLDWTVNAADAAGVSDTEGHMISSSTDYVLANHFLIDNEAGTPIAIVGNPEIEVGVPETTGFTKDIDQPVIQKDYAADDYQITITFTCSNAWTAPP
jgi:hypothetical protein